MLMELRGGGAKVQERERALGKEVRVREIEGVIHLARGRREISKLGARRTRKRLGLGVGEEEIMQRNREREKRAYGEENDGCVSRMKDC